jgi:hypothetical protein
MYTGTRGVVFGGSPSALSDTYVSEGDRLAALISSMRPILLTLPRSARVIRAPLRTMRSLGQASVTKITFESI